MKSGLASSRPVRSGAASRETRSRDDLLAATSRVDALLRSLLAEDLLLAEAEDRLPSPPPTPIFARDTVRPGRPS